MGTASGGIFCRELDDDDANAIDTLQPTMNHEGVGNPGLHRLLCSNAAPNACEATSFLLQINNITSQISRLHSRLAELEDQLRSYRTVLSPLRKMPAEILGEIFLFFLPDVLKLGARNDLINIQLVCKSWRDAARLTHKLWSALSLQDLRNVPSKKVNKWLNRAGNIPKSLVFFPPYAPPHDACTDQTLACGPLQSSALATLMANLEGTLDHLSLECRGVKCFQSFLDSFGVVEEGSTSLQRRPWDPLKSFTLKLKYEWNESPNPLRSMFLQLSPNITSFELHLPDKWSDAFEHGEDSDGAPLPLPQSLLERLTSFTLFCNWDGTQWLEDALGQCVNLETLTMDFMGTFWSCNRDQPDTERLLASGLLLPKVRTLRLQNVYPASIDILDALKAPQLVELDIDFRPDDDDVDWVFSHFVLSFVERSECEATLRSFHLRYAFMRAEELVTTLSHLPFLTHLTLEDIVGDPRHRFSDTFRQLLKKPPLQRLPSLETLELLDLEPDFSIYYLSEFLKSRRSYSMENGEPVFAGPQDTLKRLKVTYQKVQKEKQRLDTHEVVEVLRKWGGVSFDIGPILYVD